jgi:hypothetical protein
MDRDFEGMSTGCRGVCGTYRRFCLTPRDFAQPRRPRNPRAGMAGSTGDESGSGCHRRLVCLLNPYKLTMFAIFGFGRIEMSFPHFLPDTRGTQRGRNGFATRFSHAAVLAAAALGLWVVSAVPSMAAPPCALFCPFDTTLDAKHCRCVKSPNVTPIVPCGLVCAPDWKLDAQHCRCIKH